MKSAKHVVILTPGFPKDEGDDVCMPYLQDFLRIFQEQAPDVIFHVITFQYPYEAGEYAWGGIQVISLAGKNSKWKKPIVWHRAMAAIKRLHRQGRVDAVLSFWLGETARIGQKAARKLKINHVAVAMGQDVNKGNRYLSMIRHGEMKFVALSPRMARNLKQNHGLQADEIIPFAEPPANLDFETPWDARELDLIAVGSLSPLKQFHNYVEVVKMLKNTFPDIRAGLVGGGPEQDKLHDLIKRWNLTDNLQLFGQLSRSETLKKMSDAKLLVHPSAYEGMGHVFVEALDRGLCIVSTPVGLAEESEDWAVCEEVGDMAVACTRFLQNHAPDFEERKKRNRTAAEMLCTTYLELLGCR